MFGAKFVTRSSTPKTELTGLLADTWWFGLSQRVSESAFLELAHLRVRQGFLAVQLVVGIPPEVGPQNPNAASSVGPAWTLLGEINQPYLRLAAQRVALLNDLGLRVIVYGAWGHQIKWLGREKMVNWWRALVSHLDSLDVIYCLSGESNLWIGQENSLLPDRSTDDLWQTRTTRQPWIRRNSLARIIMRRLRDLRKKPDAHLQQQRRHDWSYVLDALAAMTDKPLIVHPNSGETGFQAVENPQCLSANTTQTGHSKAARNSLWQLPLEELNRQQQLFINLEPWYEGINDNFYAQDQLYAYWVTMLAGAASFCYGAHGIWNAGDGRFLSHWGKQTMAQAMALDTPRLLGLSHRQFLRHKDLDRTSYEVRGERLLFISRSGFGGRITFYPDIAHSEEQSSGRIWLPLQGNFADELPNSGPAVIFDP